MDSHFNGRRLGIRKRLGLELFRQLYLNTVREHPLRTLFWEATLRCNLNCRHCGSDCRSDSVQPDMPLEDFLHVVDTQITPHVDPQSVTVVISGGEVLLRRDLERAGSELHARGYRWGLVTNGLLLTESRFESLLQAGLNTVAVSLDGFAEQHDTIRRNPVSYVHALQAARMIAASGAVVYDVVTCVTPALMPHLEDFCRHLVENGILHWRIFTIFPVGRAAEDRSLTLSDGEFRQLMEFIRRKRREGRIEVTYACEGFLAGYETEVRDVFYYCSAGVTTASIRVDGAISGCTSIRADYDQGNIYRDDFWDVWTKRFGQFRRRDWMRRDECATCSMFRYCQGGGMHLRDGEGRLLVCHYHKL